MTVPLFGDPVPDILGEGYQALTVDLPDDDEGPVQATVVRHRAPRQTSRAVLYMHGFADYFFHTELRNSTPPAARTSTPSTCGSTVVRCARTKRRTG